MEQEQIREAETGMGEPQQPQRRYPSLGQSIGRLALLVVSLATIALAAFEVKV